MGCVQSFFLPCFESQYAGQKPGHLTHYL
eukprot:CCRYP_000476-RB/>CCRYP_000476-RB protein AED:0.48 eAED:0.48 QI:3/1/1/1/0/0/2/111/28